MLITLLFVLLLLCAGAAGCIVLLLRTTLLVVTILGESMAPTLRHGERILVRKLNIRKGESLQQAMGKLRKGQIVLLTQSGEKKPEEMDARELAQTSLVKRIVALEHEVFEGAAPSHITTMGKPKMIERTDGPQVQRWEVPAGHVFVCGDNADGSVDSRIFGPLPVQQVQGIMIKQLVSEAHPQHANLEPLS